MAELVMAMVRTKSDVVSALRMKSMLWDKGVEVSGLVVRSEDGEGIPSLFLEDMIDLKIVGFIS
jgi:hypothetical protein